MFYNYLDRPVSGEWISPSIGEHDTSSVLVGDVLRLVKMVTPRVLKLDRIAARVNLAGTAGSVVRLGIYIDSNNDGKPDTLVVDAGTIDGTVSSNAQELVISAQVGAGVFWLAQVGQGSPGTQPAMFATFHSGEYGVYENALSALGQGSAPYWDLGGISGALPRSIAPNRARGVAPRVAVRLA